MRCTLQGSSPEWRADGGLTEAQPTGAGLAAAALAARDPAALVGRRAGGRHRGSGDAAVAAVAQQLARRAGAAAGCGEVRGQG